MKKLEPLRVVLCADDRFSMPLAVCARSALANFSWKRGFELYVLSLGISPKNRSKIEASLSFPNLRLHWMEMDGKFIGHLKASPILPVSTYLRLLIPEILSEDIERVLYLDCDLVVQGDLELIWNYPIDAHLFLAAQDTGSPLVSSPLGLLNYEQLNLSANTRYFNSGVLLLNLKSWRKEEVSKRVIAYIQNHPDHIRWADQDGLNAVYSDRWGMLDKKWNLMPKEKRVDPSEFFIIHFCARPKPWEAGCRSPNSDYFFKYVDQTEWKGYRVSIWKKAVRAWLKGLKSVFTQLLGAIGVRANIKSH